MVPCSAPIFAPPRSWPSSTPRWRAGPVAPANRGWWCCRATIPEHALLQDLTQNGYGHFADTALKERRLLGLLPVQPSGLFRAEANGRDEVQLFLSRLADTLRSARYPQVQVLGPISGFMERKAGKFRMQLLVQGAQPGTAGPAARLGGEGSWRWPETKQVRWSLDIDPTELN